MLRIVLLSALLSLVDFYEQAVQGVRNGLSLGFASSVQVARLSCSAVCIGQVIDMLISSAKLLGSADMLQHQWCHGAGMDAASSNGHKYSTNG